MSAGLKVRDPGAHTTVQDLGRSGAQRYGVPSAGVLDRVGLVLANRLVGNAPETAALEIMAGGLSLEVQAESARVALAGAGAVLEIAGSNGARRVPAWRSVRLTRGQALKVSALPHTGCACLAVEGSFDLPLVLGSAATYARAGFGGLEGRTLQRGDVLPLHNAAAGERQEMALASPPDVGLDRAARVVLGPQDDFFTEEAIETFLASTYVVSISADRMGMRLEGPPLAHRVGFDIVSDGIAAGAIQVPGSRKPILLLADRQTTGGYPKIATVISADLPLVGRRRPGHRMRFEAVTIEAAVEARRRFERWLDGLASDLVPVDDVAGARLDLLYSENLVSGVVSGEEETEMGDTAS